MKFVVCVALLLSVSGLAYAQASLPLVADTAQADSQKRDRGPFVFTNRPSLRFGPLLRIDFRLKLQGDFRTFDESVSEEDGFELNRRRIGVQGHFLKYFEYEVERELREEKVWRDVFVNATYFDNFQVRAGKFKMPFGLEQLTSTTDLDFIYRTNVVDNLTPARDIGAALHGQFNKRAFGYEVGIFDGDGEDEDARVERNSKSVKRTVAARVTGRPLRAVTLPAHANDLTLGFAFTTGDVPEGPNSLRGRTAFHDRFVDPFDINGRRLRMGFEADWQPGPFSVKGEFIRVTDERKNQGIQLEDLPELVSKGWYVSGTWIVTGESKYDGVEPRRPLLRGGWGAVEVATRYERLAFGAASDSEAPSSSPRGANLIEASDAAWTAGVNWYLNRWTKVQVNVIREWIADANRSPVPDQQLFWTRVVRLQFVL